MSRNRYARSRHCEISLIPRGTRGYCFWATAVWMSLCILWFITGGADAVTGLTPTQCGYLLDEFRNTFIREGDGYPQIDSCETRVVRLMWDQLLNRVYSTYGTEINSYASLRNLSDQQFAKLIINAAAGSLMDSTQQDSDSAVIRIRVNSHGHFSRYVLHDTNRIAALQTMLVVSITTLAVTWWRIQKDKGGA